MGSYELDMMLSLVRYPNVTLEKAWTVKVIACQVTDLKFPQIDEPLVYNLYKPTMQFSVDHFTQVPSCGYSLQYTVEQVNKLTGESTTESDWLTSRSDGTELQFLIYSNLQMHIG